MKTLITEDVYGDKHEAKVEDLKLSVHVYGIAMQDGKALIVPEFNGYDWPGGTMDRGETLEETLRREVKEETGLEVEPIRILAAYTSFFHHVFKKADYQATMLFYLVKVVGGEISTAGFSENEKSYAKEARWLPLDELKTMHHVCSIDIADELLAKIEEEVNRES